MARRIAFIHTVTALIPLVRELCAELVPDADPFNIVDESLLQNTIRAGRLERVTYRRLAAYVMSARDAGAEAIMVTCSSIGPAVEVTRGLVDVPVLRIDEPMADAAVRIGRRIGVAATLSTTLEPTSALLKARAAAAGAEIELVPALAEGSFPAVMAGDTARHDELVRTSLRELGARCDVIVLSQASMARVVDTLASAERPVPILSSPRLGIERLAQVLAGT